ncbi:hypothetical protein LTR78_007833 [Recurvomyces mirabilis]|uniref:Mediator of RNA polymerase II transcription subunit 19 n=2 Tax=Recurvomyces mirabilis TaxID=574656 RepID=A0AAE0TR76_9PEZI|nr:hypothetical protein LTR78_007833 [Recurvomyces mirabilis]
MSSDGERSPKRQRRSYSPASPALPETKQSFVQPPHTPPPSVHSASMSPAWQPQHVSQQQQNGGGVTFPTPPSTAGLQSQVHGSRSEEGMESGQYTPATDSDPRRDGDGDAEMVDGDEVEVGDVSMASITVEQDAGHRRTDHEREDTVGDSEADMLPPPPPRLYKLHSQPIAPARPHFSSNLIELYGLESLQASVARRDAAGTKINKLRKSYEGKVKALNLEGRSKASVGDNALAGLLDPLWEMDMGNGMTGWQQKVNELPLDNPSAQADVLSKLDSAISMQPGHLPKPEHQTWKTLLSLDEPKPTPAMPATKPFTASASFPNGPPSTNPALAKTAPMQALRSSAPSSPAVSHLGGVRPERSGKKRRYDEASYSGYQEGFDDDGYSTGDGASRRGSASKRQKTGGMLAGGTSGRKLSVSLA